MLSSLHARMMRTAISPRFAIRIFSNMPKDVGGLDEAARLAILDDGSGWADLKQGLAKLHRFSVLDHDLGNHALGLRLDLVHHLHRLDDTDDCLGADLRAHFNIRRRFRGWGSVESANHGGFDFDFVAGRRWGRGSRSSSRNCRWRGISRHRTILGSNCGPAAVCPPLEPDLEVILLKLELRYGVLLHQVNNGLYVF